VCGTAAATLETQVVDDVTVCNNYIPCDDVTRSEIVVPVFGRNLHCEADVSAASAAPKKVRHGRLRGGNARAPAAALASAGCSPPVPLPVAHTRSNLFCPRLQLIAVLDIDTGEVAGYDGVDKAHLEALMERWFMKY
jgi:putative methionine-R-sulfoxide reductase with GAF domain